MNTIKEDISETVDRTVTWAIVFHMSFTLLTVRGDRL